VKIGRRSRQKFQNGTTFFCSSNKQKNSQQKAQPKLQISADVPEPSEVSGGYLRIHMREGHYRDRSVKVYVTYVKLEKISASSAANVFSSETLKGERLVISASSAASVDLPVDVKNLDISASSAADVELKGVAQSVDLDVSSAGEIDTYDLEADDVSSTASSAGSIKLSVKKSIRAHASSGGTIRYRGNPSQSNTNSSSGGSVRKIN
jgi:hypothetical protein